MVKATLDMLAAEADAYVRRRLVIAVVLGLSLSALVGVSPVLLGAAVDSLSASPPYSQLFPSLLIVSYAGCQWFVRSMREVQWLVYGLADRHLERRVSLRLLEHVMRLPLRFHLGRRTGALNHTLNNGLFGLRLILQHLIFSALPVVVEVFTTMAVLAYLGHPFFLALIGASALLYAATFARGAVQLRRAADSASRASIDANGLLADCILNYETVKSFNAEYMVLPRFDSALAHTEQRWRFFYRGKFGNGLAIAAIFSCSVGFSLLVATRSVLQDRMSVGDFVLVHTYLLQIIKPLEMIGFAVRDISQGFAFVAGMAELLNQRGEETDRPRTDRLISAGFLEFSDVTFSYQPGRPVIQGVSFSVAAGSTVAVVGLSGSGKSSLIRLLVRFCDPDSGVIRIDGIAVTDLSLVHLRASISVVPQDIALFNESIAYNIEVARPGCGMADVERAAQVAQLCEFIAQQPHGIETKVGERGVRLSGGERQRIAIARAVLRRPRIFVFDEATSALDSTTEQHIVRRISEMADATTTLIVAHRLSTVVTADEIVVLDRGRLVERGKHADLVRTSGIYAKMWASQYGRVPTGSDRAHVAAELQ